jgi:L-histidine N-alpha-methyltransferase
MELSRVEIVAVDDEAAFWDDRSALLTCLQETPPRVPAYFGYDALGSELFESITELPDYYLTRVEYGLLQRHAEEIADLIGCERIAELGSGSAKKTRLRSWRPASSVVRPPTFRLTSAARCWRPAGAS